MANVKDKPLTIRILLLWCSSAGIIIGATLYIGAMKSEQGYAAQRIDAVEQKQTKTDETVSDLKAKIDHCLTILERIDKRVGNP